MAFFSAALGQAALTGVAIGLLLGEPLNAPYGGMFGFCLLSTLAMVYVKRHATLPPDTLIGVFHALTLGLGSVPARRADAAVQRPPGRVGAVRQPAHGDRRRSRCCSSRVGVVVAVLLVREYNHLLLDSLSPPLATVAGAELGVPRVLLRHPADAVDRRQPEDHRRAAGRGARRRAGGGGAQRRARHAQLSRLERRRGVPRGRRRARRSRRGSWCRPAAPSCWRSARSSSSRSPREPCCGGRACDSRRQHGACPCVPLSARAELLLVVRAAMAIAVGVWIYLASSASTLGGGAGASATCCRFRS